METKERRKRNNELYVYALLDPRKPGKWTFKKYKLPFEPFYIGCGRRDRAESHFSPRSIRIGRNKRKDAIITSIINETGKKPLVFRFEVDVKPDAGHELEVQLTKHFGRIDLGTGILTNQKDGNVNPSPEVRDKASIRMKGKAIFMTDEAKRKKSVSLSGRKRPKELVDRMKELIKRPIIAYTLSGNRIGEYPSVEEASIHFKVCRPTITNSILRDRPTKNGIFFQYKLGKDYYRPSPKRTKKYDL